MADTLKMTDDELYKFSNAFFEGEDSSEICIPLDSIELIDGTSAKINGKIHRFNSDDFKMLSVKKTKYELAKSQLDYKTISIYVQEQIKTAIDIRLEETNNILLNTVELIETSLSRTNSAVLSLNNVVTGFNGEIKSLKDNNDKFKTTLNGLTNEINSLNDSVEKVMSELKILIQE